MVKSKRISVRFEPEIKAVLDNMAAKDKRTVSAFIEKLPTELLMEKDYFKIKGPKK